MLFRSLRHFWRMHLAVCLGASVTSAVLTGALLVGDSVRDSLQALTLDRLGGIDEVILSTHFFRRELLEDLRGTPVFEANYEHGSSIIQAGASAVHAASQARASRVRLYAVDDAFSGFFSDTLDFSRSSGQSYPSVIVNEPLRGQLGAEVGDDILLSFQRHSKIHRESILGERDSEDQLLTARVRLVRVLPEAGMGRFELKATQATPLVAYVELDVLQRLLGIGPNVNTVLLARRPGSSPAQEDLKAALKSALRFEDLALESVAGRGFFSIQSSEFLLSDAALKAADSVIQANSYASYRILTYLANRIEGLDSFIPYSTVSAVDPVFQPGLPGLKSLTGDSISALSEGEIVLNAWAARDLGVSIGDRIELSYYVVGPRSELKTERSSFRLVGIAAMYELGADPALTPDVPGIHDRQDMTGWDPPFPVRLDWIRSADEDYWDRYRAAPKAFISMADAVRLWRSRFGDITSIRIAGGDSGSSEGRIHEFESQFLSRIESEKSDFVLESPRESGLSASSGPTDFAGLFLGFSFFLILSAALLTALMFRLGVERRVREVGLLLSLGFTPRQVLVRFLEEGLVLGGLGAVLGLGMGVFYAWLLMLGLRTWWLPAVGTSALSLFVHPQTLALSFAVALAVIALSIWLVVRKLVRMPMPSLLSGETSPSLSRGSRRPLVLGILAACLALSLLAGAFWPGRPEGAGLSGESASMLFFSTGVLLLAAGISFFAAWCRGSIGRPLSWRGVAALFGIAARNTARNTGRSLLSLVLVASACFIIIAVAAFRPGSSVDSGRESGTGGFQLVAESEIPLLKGFSDRDSVIELGLDDDETELLSGLSVYPSRLLPGDDTSCLNLYRPEKPRLLGVPGELLQRGGFTVSAIDETSSPWELLNLELGTGVVPAFGDQESVLWILHKALGDEIVLEDESGRPLRLRLVGLVQDSIFQSELLISENHFLRYFPSGAGHSFFLIDGPAESMTSAARILEREFGRFGLDVVAAEARLAGFHAVRSTYISTFQTLGALGLLLGTLGLGIILFRNVLERRTELAAMRAFGFRRVTLAWIVVLENGFLLVLGVVLGSASAMVSAAPMLVREGGGSLSSLLPALGAVLLVGMLACAVSVRSALRIPMLPALRSQ